MSSFDPSLYPATYRASVGYSIFFHLLSGIAIVAGSLAAWYFGTGHEMRTAREALIFCLVSVCFVFLGLNLAYSVLRSKVILSADAVTLQGLFTARTLLRGEIGGRRVVGTQYFSILELIPRSRAQKKLKIPLFLRTDLAFHAWFEGISDLDAKDLAESEAQLAVDPDLGFRSNERQQQVASARRTATTLNVVGGIAGAWGLFFPRPYSLIIFLLAIVPLIVMAVLARSRGIYQIEGRRTDSRPALTLAFLIPGLALGFRAIDDMHMLRWEPILLLTAICALLLAWLLIRSDHRLWRRPAAVILIVFFGVFYSDGLVAALNALLDRSEPRAYETVVTDKHMSSGKTTTYYLRLEPWGPQTATDDESVPYSLYESRQIGDRVCVYLHSGALNAPWYDIGRCR